METVKGQMVLGTARVIVQNGNEETPRVTECPVVACDQVAAKGFKRAMKRMARKYGSFMALLALAALVGKSMPAELGTHQVPMVIGAITSALANSFKTELGTATHNFTNGTGHTYKCALYTSAATINASTTAYSATNEVSGTGYSAGGATIVSSTPVLSGSTALFDFTDAQWTTASFTANGCLVYNTSSANRAVFAIAFGADQTVTAGTFTIQWPVPDASNAIIRLT